MLTLSGDDSYSGGTIVSGGTLQAGSITAFSPTSLVSVGSSGTLALNGFSNTILNLTGSGSVTLGIGTLTFGDATHQTFSGTISGSGGSLVKVGSGIATFSGSNSYSGNTDINAGTLQSGANNVFSSSSVVAIASGATLDLNGFVDTISNLSGVAGSLVTLGSGTLTTGDSSSQTFFGSISGSGGNLIKQGTGGLTLGGSNSYTGSTTVNAGTLILSGSNTASGVTTINTGGTLQAGASGAFSPNSLFVVQTGGSLILNGFSEAISNLSGSGSAILGAGTLTLGDSTNQTFSGVVSGSGGNLVYQGAGSLTLSGTNTYTGKTSVNSGLLILSGSNIASGATSIGSGATLQAGVGNAFSPNSAVTVASGGTLAVNGFVETISNLSGAGVVTLGSGTLFVGDTTSQVFSGSVSGTGGNLVKQGTGSLTLSGSSTYSGMTTISAGTLQAGAVDAFSPNSLVSVGSSGTVALNGFSNTVLNLEGDGAVTLGSGTLTLGNSSTQIFSGAMSGSGGSLAIQGTGTFVLSGTATYTGATTVESGTLEAGANNAFSSSSAVAVQGGAVLNLNGFSETIANLSGAGSVTLGGGTLTMGNGSSSGFAGAISQSGTVVKQGVGTLTLSGSNSYSGPTALNAGTLGAGASGAFSPNSVVTIASTATVALNGFTETVSNIAGSGSITLGGGTLIVGDSSSQDFFGVISEAGDVTKQGSGTLILSGTNTYTGLTTIAAGTLELGIADALSTTSGIAIGSAGTFNLNNFSYSTPALSGSGSLVLGSGTLTMTNTLAQDFGGVISGSGGFIEDGTATMTLSGSNTYLGPTLINNGTLALSGAGSISNSSAVTLASTSVVFDLSAISDASTTVQDLSDAFGGTINLGSKELIFGTDAPATLASIIAGVGGSLFYQGAGALTLTGANSYTGSTTISDATLNLVGDGTIASSSGLILSLTTGTGFDISGISAASTTVQSIVSAGAGINLGSKELIFNSPTSFTLDGPIVGSGSIVKEGVGTASFAGDNLYTGTTTVTEGRLSINGSITSPVTVSSGATLGGSGSITGAVRVDAGGTLTAGNSIGTLTIVGDLTLMAGAITSLEINPSQSSRIVVDGAATLTGTLSITVDSGLYRTGSQFTLLTTTHGLSGTFDPVVFSQTFDGVVSYPTGTVILVLLAPSGSIPTSNLTGNSLVIANYINRLPPDLFSDVVDYLAGLTSSEMSDAMLAISPSRDSFGTYAIENNAFSIARLLSTRMSHRQNRSVFKKEPLRDLTAMCLPLKNGCKMIPTGKQPCLKKCAPHEINYSFWVSQFGNVSNQDAQEQNPAFRFSATGPIVGVDLDPVQENIFLGAMAGYLASSVHDYNGYGNQAIQSVVFGCYGMREGANAFLEGYLGGCYNTTKSKRRVTFTGFDEIATSTFTTWQLIPHGKFGYRCKLAPITLTPFVSLDIPIAFRRGYEEHGADIFSMQIRERTTSFLQFLLGLSGTEKWDLSPCSITFQQEVGYIYRAPFATGRTTAAIIGAPSFFQVVSFMGDEHIADLSADLLVQSRQGIFGFFSVDGQIGSGYRSLELFGGLGADF